MMAVIFECESICKVLLQDGYTGIYKELQSFPVVWYHMNVAICVFVILKELDLLGNRKFRSNFRAVILNRKHFEWDVVWN